MQASAVIGGALDGVHHLQADLWTAAVDRTPHQGVLVSVGILLNQIKGGIQ